MVMKAILDTLDDLDESLREHYKQDPASKKYVLDIEDFDSAPRVVQLKNEAGKHRIKAKELDTKLTGYTALGTVDEVQSKLDEVETLRVAAEGKVDQTKIDALVDGKLKLKLAPVERERDQLKTQIGDLTTQINDFKNKDVVRTIGDHVREAIRKSAGFVGHAEDDALMFAERHLTRDDEGNVVTKDGVGVTPGVSAAVWLQEMQVKKPHWWGTTAGGGASGNKGGNGTGGKNPFSAADWNVTEQGRLVVTDRKRAEQLAKSAGTTIGGRKPEPKK